MEGPCSKCCFPMEEAGYDKYDPGDTPLMFAACNGHVECVDAWLQAGTYVDETNIKGDTALQWAAEKGHDKCVAFLLEKGADVDKTDINGLTALMAAAYKDNENCIKILLQAGADVNMTDNINGSALIYAAGYGKDKCLRQLLTAGTDVNTVTTNRENALHLAASWGYDKCIDILLKAGADVNIDGVEGKSPLIYAAISSNVKSVDLLIKAGADVNARNEEGETPLMSSMSVRQEDLEEDIRDDQDINDFSSQKCADLLLKTGADVNAEDKYKRTALFAAARNGHYECIIVLLKAGTQINTGNDRKNALESYIHYAETMREDIAMLLFAAGEKLSNVDEDQIPAVLDHTKIKLKLKHMCREAIRNHLLELNLHDHLFHRIPQLGLPSPITRYLLYYMSLDVADDTSINSLTKNLENVSLKSP